MEIFYKIFESIFKLSIYGTITAILILLFKGIFKNKLSARFHYFIWFILILRISIPILPETYENFYEKGQIKNNHLSSQNEKAEEFLPENAFLNDNNANTHKSLELNDEINENSEKSNIQSNTIDNHIQVKNFVTVLKILYFPVAVLIILYYLFGYVLLKVRSKKYKKCTDETVIAILEYCKEKLNINKKIKLLVDNENKSPMIFGIVNTKVVIPRNIIRQANYENLKYIMLHELFHYKTQDLVINWISNILNAIYWFNPIILFSLKQMKNDCENKTDECVITGLNREEQINYGKAILYVIANLSKNSNIIGSNTILGGKNQMKKRINNIVNFKKPAMISTGIAALLSITIGGFCFTNSVASSISLEDSKNTSSNANSTSLNSNNSDASMVNVENNEKNNYSSKEVIAYLNGLQSRLPDADALDKESMLKKMYNTGAYIASASGEYVETSHDGHTSEVKYDFKVSDDNKILSYETTKSSMEEGSRISLRTLDEYHYNINNTYRNYTKFNSKTEPIENLLPKNPIVNPDKVYTISSDGIGQLDRVFPPIAGAHTVARQKLAPSEIYGGFLITDGTWDITGSEDYLGFNCAIIEGTLKDGNYSKKLQTKNFKLWVDSATGVLLKYEWYNENGDLSGTLNTKRLEINKYIPDDIFTVDGLDLSGYEDSTRSYIDNVPQQEPSVLESKVKNSITDKISEDKYNGVIKNRSVTLEWDNKEQILIKMTKIGKPSEDIINSLREELKDLVLLNIENENVKPSEIFFIIYDNEAMTKDIKQYIISKDGFEPGWNVNN